MADAWLPLLTTWTLCQQDVGLGVPGWEGVGEPVRSQRRMLRLPPAPEAGKLHLLAASALSTACSQSLVTALQGSGKQPCCSCLWSTPWLLTVPRVSYH